VHEAGALLAERFGKITLERVSESGKAIYRVAGEVDFFGEEGFTRVDGAGAGIARRVRTRSGSLWLPEANCKLYKSMPESSG
jgi:hypothetical protein